MQCLFHLQLPCVEGPIGSKEDVLYEMSEFKEFPMCVGLTHRIPKGGIISAQQQVRVVRRDLSMLRGKVLLSSDIWGLCPRCLLVKTPGNTNILTQHYQTVRPGWPSELRQCNWNLPSEFDYSSFAMDFLGIW
ncbi:hypothetical protein AB6A40_000785 [Gnathostoma spinigerum]|uniref:Uncharacterized protein n=1 Tax=Gnathostoma spinigerum TaxID=75299 RepID=A0ABD6E411_9BILA